MCLVGGIRTATKSKGVFQADSLSTELSMLTPSNAQNTRKSLDIVKQHQNNAEIWADIVF